MPRVAFTAAPELADDVLELAIVAHGRVVIVKCADLAPEQHAEINNALLDVAYAAAEPAPVAERLECRPVVVERLDCHRRRPGLGDVAEWARSRAVPLVAFGLPALYGLASAALPDVALPG